jgi:hypothetical protein
MLTDGWWEQEIENFKTKVELVWGKLPYFIVCLRHILLRILGNFSINNRDLQSCSHWCLLQLKFSNKILTGTSRTDGKCRWT